MVKSIDATGCHSKRAVVLLSGGIDSTTVLALAKASDFEVFALTVAYGQTHEVEVQVAKRIASNFEIAGHFIISANLQDIALSPLTGDHPLPLDRSPEEITSEVSLAYVPARNTIFLSLALALSESIDAQHIFIGINKTDSSSFPDCRPEFVKAFEALANLATKTAAIQGRLLQITAPLLSLNKTEVLQLGLKLGVDYSMTLSCYYPTENLSACGRCDACSLRRNAFKSLGLDDPASYAERVL